MAGEQIELCSGPAGHGGGHARAQSFFHGPKRLRLVCCFDDDDSPRIETEAVQAMAMQPAIGRGGYEHHGAAGRQAAEQGGDEAEGGRLVCSGYRHDFMHSGQGQPALRQAGIKSRETEGQDLRV